ncbi:MAG: hypothetical protein LBJ90_00325 [Treponema sp.]|nr:hypothetical protein [Treponema sp.]
MRKRKLFIRFLRAELEDTIEGIEQLSFVLESRLQKGEITNYVYNENKAFLNREIAGLRKLLPLLEGVDIEAGKDINTLALETGNMLQLKANAADDPQVVTEIINRKIKKVLNYITEQPE